MIAITTMMFRGMHVGATVARLLARYFVSAFAGPTLAQQSGRSRVLPNPLAAGQQWVHIADPGRGQGVGQFGSPRQGGRTHAGIDLAADPGTPVQVVRDGRVIRSESQGPWCVSAQGPQNPIVNAGRRENRLSTAGNNVVVAHPDGSTSHYYHLGGTSKPAEGDRLVAGQMIGRVGRTGNVPDQADPHLHLEYRASNGTPVRPEINGLSSTEYTQPISTRPPGNAVRETAGPTVVPRQPAYVCPGNEVAPCQPGRRFT